MDRKDIEKRVSHIVKTLSSGASPASGSAQGVFEWDSLKQIEIVFAVEDEFDCQFPEAVLPTLRNKQVVIDCIEAMLDET